MRKWIIALLFTACSHSMDDYQKDGESLSSSMTQLLSQVESKEDIEQLAPKLEKKVEQLTQLMIDARKYQLKHSTQTAPIAFEATHQLRQEMERISKIQGVEEVWHRIQRHSMHKLDASERIQF